MGRLNDFDFSRPNPSKERLTGMRTQSRRVLTTLLLALVTVGPLGGFANADEAGPIGPASGATDAALVPEGSVLATPQDVASSGGTAAEVAAQEAVWAALPASVAREQRRLIASEQAKLDAFLSGTTEGKAATLADSAGVVTPMAGQTYCASGDYNSYYKVRQAGIVQCFGGSAGIVDLNPYFSYWGTPNVELQSGGYAGRVRYTKNSTWMNTIWRYPDDYTWHLMPEFEWQFNIVVRRVEIQSDL